MESHQDEHIKSAGGSLNPLELDVNDKSSIQNAVQLIEKSDGYLNILVNNAGVKSQKTDVDSAEEDVDKFVKSLFSLEREDWFKTLETNVIAVYYVSVAFLPLLIKGNEKYRSTHETGTPHPSSILIISSMSGITQETQGGQFPYQVSKAGAIDLTSLLAKEFGRPKINVRVNSIAPGYFPSEMTTGESNEQNKSHVSADNYREKKDVIADRAGRDEDMAQAALSLVCNQYINGQILSVDGGWLIHHS